MDHLCGKALLFVPLNAGFLLSLISVSARSKQKSLRPSNEKYSLFASLGLDGWCNKSLFVR